MKGLNEQIYKKNGVKIGKKIGKIQKQKLEITIIHSSFKKLLSKD